MSAGWAAPTDALDSTITSASPASQGCYLCASAMVCGATSSRFRQEEVFSSLRPLQAGITCSWCRWAVWVLSEALSRRLQKEPPLSTPDVRAQTSDDWWSWSFSWSSTWPWPWPSKITPATTTATATATTFGLNYFGLGVGGDGYRDLGCADGAQLGVEAVGEQRLERGAAGGVVVRRVDYW